MFTLIYIINSANNIGVNGAKSIIESFANLPTTLHTFHLNIE
jgi:hypothetical protein